MKRIGAILTLGLLSSSYAQTAFACAVCGAGEDDPTRNAFTASTAFLSFIPLIAIGGVIFTVYRYVKGSEAVHVGTDSTKTEK